MDINFSEIRNYKYNGCIEFIFSVDSIHCSLYCNFDKEYVHIEFNNNSVFYKLDYFLAIKIINEVNEKKIKSIIKRNGFYFFNLYHLINQSNDTISSILKNPILNHFYENFESLKTDPTIENTIKTIASEFISEYKKYNLYPNVSTYNYKFNNTYEYISLLVLSYFCGDISKCSFFYDHELFDELISSDFKLRLLQLHNENFFSDKIQHSLLNFEKTNFFFNSIEESVDYFISKKTIDYSLYFLEHIDGYYLNSCHFSIDDLIHLSSYFVDKLISIYDYSSFDLNFKLFQKINVLNDFNNDINNRLNCLLNIIKIHQEKLELKVNFIMELCEKIYNYLFLFNEKIVAARIFYSLNEENRQILLEYLHKNYQETCEHINILTDYCLQKDLIENF